MFYITTNVGNWLIIHNRLCIPVTYKCQIVDSALPHLRSIKQWIWNCIRINRNVFRRNVNMRWYLGYFRILCPLMEKINLQLSIFITATCSCLSSAPLDSHLVWHLSVIALPSLNTTKARHYSGATVSIFGLRILLQYYIEALATRLSASR